MVEFPGHSLGAGEYNERLRHEKAQGVSQNQDPAFGP